MRDSIQNLIEAKQDPPELTSEGVLVIAGAIREIAMPISRSWESVVATVAFVIFVVSHPAVVSTRIPNLLGRSTPDLIAELVILSLCAGCGFSAARLRRRRGRIVGAVISIVSAILLFQWLVLLIQVQDGVE